MTALPTVVGLSDYLPIMVLATGLVAFMGLVLVGMSSGNPRAYFRIWMPAVLITAAITATCGFGIWWRHAESIAIQKRIAANSQMYAIETAAFSYFLAFDKWPAGTNREVIEKLLKSGEVEPTSWDRAKLKFAPDGSALDPWGRPYDFGVDPESGLQVHSCGPDGIKDTEDDLR